MGEGGFVRAKAPGVPVKRKRWDDKRLARRIARGDEDACVALVRAHHQSIFAFLLHLGRDRQLAEDVTQETFAAAWMGMGGFNGTSSLATWLHRIAYRKFVDSRRRDRLPTEPSPPSPAGQEPLHEESPLDRLVADEESRRLRRAVAGMDDATRETIVLHYFQGLSYREMADVLDQPTGTVKWRTSQALAQLKALLEASNQDEIEG